MPSFQVVEGHFAGGWPEAHIHTDFDEDVDDADVLANGELSLGADAAAD